MTIIEWLLQGDVSIQYQTKRDLLDNDDRTLKKRIATEGFGKQLLDLQQPSGHWSEGYYAYKWISTHYTLLEIRRLEMDEVPSVIHVCHHILHNNKVEDGGVMANPKNWSISDICINGMMLFVFCYYNIEEELLQSMVDRILRGQLDDGGFNCNADFQKVSHSSLHSTVSIIEGFNEYLKTYSYRKDEVKQSRDKAIEFILMHRLFKSDKTGEIIHKNFLKLSYPPRWKYDILRGLEALKEANTPYDERMEDALEVIMKKRRKNGTWPVQNKHSGKVHFDMEKIGGPSRWNTLRILRVLRRYKPKQYNQMINQPIMLPHRKKNSYADKIK